MGRGIIGYTVLSRCRQSLDLLSANKLVNQHMHTGCSLHIGLTFVCAVCELAAACIQYHDESFGEHLILHQSSKISHADFDLMVS
jgi:hypothetical protein